MIRHIVTFQFRNQSAEGKHLAAEKLRGALEPLKHAVPDVLSLEIGIDDGAVPGHWDAVLVSLHPSAEALAAYQAHPAHLDALGTVATLVSNKSVVDAPWIPTR